MPGGPTFRDDERGFTIIEVLVSAAMLVVMSLALLSTLDGAQATSSANRARSVAADVAEQDQERMRGMKITALSNYSAQHTDTVGGIPYQVASSAAWVRDANGAPVSCTSGAGQADYMQITSTVTPVNAVGQRQPVVMKSLMAPPVGSFGTEGTLALKVKDRADAAQPGVPVAISGPESRSGTTNSLGCVVFDYVKPGTYNMVLNTPGWVTQQGVTNYTINGTVTTGNVNTTEVVYDKAAPITVNFVTQPLGAATEQPTIGTSARVNNGLLTGPSGYRQQTQLYSAGKSDMSFPSTFPFSDGYAVYSGTCTQANPTSGGANSGYFTTSTIGKRQQVATNPGVPVTAIVREPAINIEVRKGTSPTTSPLVDGAHVKINSTTSGCESFDLANATTAGVLNDPGMPFGTYQICVDALTTVDSKGNPARQFQYYGTSTNPQTNNTSPANVSNMDPNGTAKIPILLNNGTSSSSNKPSSLGTCP
jgi:type II secretory pathway pseudopilin PulG